MDKPVKDYTIDDFRMKREELGEKGYRHYLGQLVINGDYSISGLSKQSGVSRNTIRKAINEIKNGITDDDSVYQRKPGGGRKSLYYHSPSFRNHLEKIIDGDDFFNPFKVFHWTALDLKTIQQKLNQDYGIDVSHVTIANTLKSMGYQLTGSNKARLQKTDIQDIHTQYHHIGQTVEKHIEKGMPAVLIHLYGIHEMELMKSNCSKEIQNEPNGFHQMNPNTFLYCRCDYNQIMRELPTIRWWLHFGLPNYPNADSVFFIYDTIPCQKQLSVLETEFYLFSKTTGLNVQAAFIPPGTYYMDLLMPNMIYSSDWGQSLGLMYCFQLVGTPDLSKAIQVQMHPDDSYIAKSIDAVNAVPIMEHSDPIQKWNYHIHF